MSKAMGISFYYLCVVLMILSWQLATVKAEQRSQHYLPTDASILKNWNSSITNRFDGNGKESQFDMLSDKLFRLSHNDSSMILTDITNCLASYKMYDCVKLMLLSGIKALVYKMDASDFSGKDIVLIRGVTFKWQHASDTTDHNAPKKQSDLNDVLNYYILRLFEARSLQILLLPHLGIEFTPKSVQDQDGLVCFTAKTFTSSEHETRKKSDSTKNEGFNMMPMMIVPQMIMLGMLPFALANLKVMVMNAFMMNTMALNGAIFMTIRNLVFGPKNGPKVKYVNYGYNKGKVNKKPELVLHSPAAFVKKPDKHGHPQLLNHYDDPNTYQVRRQENKNRKNNPQKNPTKIKAPIPENSSDYHKTAPYYSFNHPGTAQEDQATQAFKSSFTVDSVDAPISYLNNNQFLEASSQTGVSQKNNEVQNSLSYSSTEPYQYHSYNNIFLQSQSNNFNEYDSRDYPTKNTFSAKYNEENFENDNLYHSHNNHKLKE